MKLTRTGIVLLSMLMVMGCSGTKLALEKARVDPSMLAPGDQAVIIINVIDKDSVVANVTATVVEYPDIVLNLNDNGENGDKVSGDGIWSYQIEVPGETDPGIYKFKFDAYDKNGKKLKITNDDGNIVPISAETAVEVTN